MHALCFLHRKAEDTCLREKEIAQARDCFYSFLFWYSLSCTDNPFLSGGEVERGSRGTRSPSLGDMYILEKHLWGQILRWTVNMAQVVWLSNKPPLLGPCQPPTLVIDIYPHSFPATMNAGFNTILQQATYSEALLLFPEWQWSLVCVSKIS